MYTQSLEHFKEEKRLAELLRSAPSEKRSALFGDAYDFIHSRCLEEKASEKIEDHMFGTDRQVVCFLKAIIGKGKNVLEIGCGCGYASIELCRNGNKVTGIDISRIVIEKAKGFARNLENIDFQVGDASQFAFPDSFFDRAFCIDAFEHIHPDDTLRHLKEVYRTLRKGGEYIIITVNKHLGPHDVTRSALNVEDLGETPPQGFHLREYSFEEIFRLLKTSGFHQIRSNLLPWRRFPRNIFLHAGAKVLIERVLAGFPKGNRKIYKLMFRLFALASMVYIARKS